MSASDSPAATGQSRRFGFFVAILLLVNAFAWVGYHRWYQRGLSGMLEVMSVTPADKVLAVSRPVLFWHFNMDMEQGPEDGMAPGTIAPTTAGRWLWTDPRTLSFVAEGDLPKATPFTFTLQPERFRSKQGAALAEPYVTSVHTAALKVQFARQAGMEAQDQYVLELGFSDRVLPADVGTKLSLLLNGQPVKYKLLGQAPSETVRVITDPVVEPGPEAATLRVLLKEGILGSQGPLAMEQPFDQEILLDKVLSVTGISAQSPAEGEPQIELAINGEVDLALLKPLVSVEPAVPFVLSSGWHGVQLHGEFVAGTRYQVKIAGAAGAPGSSGAVRTPRAGKLSVVIPDRDPCVWFAYGEGYLGSGGNRTVLAHAVNVPELKLCLWRVYDNNIVSWRANGRRHHYWDDSTRYSQPIRQKRISLTAARNKVQDITISLDELMQGGKEGQGELLRDGVYRLTMDVVTSPKELEDDWREDRGYGSSDSTVVTLSDIGLTTKRSAGTVTVWAVSLATAKPMQNVRVRVYSNKSQLLGEGITGADGLVSVGNLHPAEDEDLAVVLADTTEGKGLTWVDLNAGTWSLADADVKGKAYLRRGNEAFVYTDRGVYRPGEMVHLRAIVRDAEMRKAESFPVKWQLRRPDLHDWRSNAAILDGDGAVQWAVQLPADVPTGCWQAELLVPGGKQTLGEVSFNVEEFVPNRLKASVRLQGEGIQAVEGKARTEDSEDSEQKRLVAGEQAVTAELQADYLFGRPAEGLNATISASLEAAAFSPARWDGWTFGDDAHVMEGMDSTGRVKVEAAGEAADKQPKDGERTATVDANGRATWSLSLKELKQGVYAGPWQLSVEASVMEPGGRAVSAYDSAMVDVRRWYIGIREPAAGLQPDVEGEVEVALVAVDGSVARVDTTVAWKLLHENWSNPLVYERGRYRYASQRKLDPVAGGEGRAEMHGGHGLIRVKAPFAGPFVLQVGSEDAAGTMTSKTLYVADGSTGWHDNISRENPERLQLGLVALSNQGSSEAVTQPTSRPRPATMPAAMLKPGTRFGVGDTVGILVRSPFPGRLLLSVEADEVVSVQVLEMRDTAMVVPVKLSSTCRPNAYITASVVRNVEPNARWRIHRACGAVRVSIDPGNQKLNMAIETPVEIRPESPFRATVIVTDAEGKPVPDAAVTVAAVDEGVLQLTDFASPDPLGLFYARRALGVTSGDIYSVLMPEVPRPDKTSNVGGDAAAGRHLSSVHANRAKSVALVSEVLHTDAQGRAMADFAVPAFNGRLRVMAVGSSASAVGSASGSVLVRSPLMVQSSFPRFVAPQDHFAATVTVFNNTKDSGEAKVTVTADGTLLTIAKGSQPVQAITLKAGEQQTLLVPLEAGQGAGVGKVSVSVVMGTEQMQESVEMTIRPAAPTMTHGGYASVEPGKPFDVALGDAMLPGTRLASVKVTAWPTLSLPDGLDYLDRYPYGCAEQVISTCFPLVYLSDIGQRIAPGAFEKQRIAEKLQAGVYHLMGMQTADGGIAMWPGSSESWPWASVYAANMLIEAERSGFNVPADFKDHLIEYVRRLLDKMPDGEMLEAQSYACYVLAVSGKPNRAAMSRLDELSRPMPDLAVENAATRSQARLHLAMAQVAAGRRDLAAAMIPEALPAPRPDRQLSGNIGSPIRDQAMLVSALLSVNPEHPALPALVQKLADGGREGHWRSTQDCAFAVMAVGRYLRQAKAQTPFDTVELADAAQVLSRAGKGQSILWNIGDVGGVWPQRVRITATGAPESRAHVSWLITGVPTAIPAGADNGMRIRRKYLDLQRHEVALESLESGDLVQVELTVDTPAAMDNIVIEDLLPAGLEIENSRLVTAAGRDRDTDEKTKASVFQTSRIDVRDDRLVIVGATPAPGAFHYTYLARAITPGRYVIPPVRGECMYDIGVNSISGGGGTMAVLSAKPKEALAK